MPRQGDNVEDITTYGVLVDDVCALPSTADVGIANTLNWPEIEKVAVSEYNPDIKVFAMAFPWLFPGGVGDFQDFRDQKVTAGEWARRMIMYEDARFLRDKAFCFFALNYVVRRRNQSEGNFFVNTFATNGKSDLPDLQKEIEEGNLSFINQISYFSNTVQGSNAYWRDKRSQLYSWISHHVEKKNGAPNFFITLSCAEYFWPDIFRLVEERIEIATGEKKKLKVGDAGIIQCMNEYSSVVQEYFQQRAEEWLDSVGKDVFGIDHYWMRYEFAPSRGQIHAHILAVCNDKKVLRLVHETRDDPERQAEVLATWASNKFCLTACTSKDEKETVEDPVSIYLADVKDMRADAESLKKRVQGHSCSNGYCLRTQSKKKKEAEKPRWVCFVDIIICADLVQKK